MPDMTPTTTRLVILPVDVRADTLTAWPSVGGHGFGHQVWRIPTGANLTPDDLDALIDSTKNYAHRLRQEGYPLDADALVEAADRVRAALPATGGNE